MEKSKIAELMKKLKIPKPWPAGFYLKPEGKRILKALIAENLSSRDIAKVLGKSYGAILNIYTHAGISLPGKLVAKNSKNGSKIKEKIKEEELAKFSAQLKKEERTWPEPEILEISEEAWRRPGTKRSYTSRWDYKGSDIVAALFYRIVSSLPKRDAILMALPAVLLAKNILKR